jgi:hypothetical protein
MPMRAGEIEAAIEAAFEERDAFVRDVIFITYLVAIVWFGVYIGQLFGGNQPYNCIRRDTHEGFVDVPTKPSFGAAPTAPIKPSFDPFGYLGDL